MAACTDSGCALPQLSKPKPRCAQGTRHHRGDDTLCCVAEKTETWLHALDTNEWESYVKNADSEQSEAIVLAGPKAHGCCGAGADFG